MNGDVPEASVLAADRNRRESDECLSTEPGKEADIAVWDKDMYTIPSAELRNLKCGMTIYPRTDRLPNPVML